MGAGGNLLDSSGNSDMCHKQVVVIMSSNQTEKEYKTVISEIRNALLLALRYSRGENANPIRAGTHIKMGLDKLEKLEEKIA